MSVAAPLTMISAPPFDVFSTLQGTVVVPRRPFTRISWPPRRSHTRGDLRRSRLDWFWVMAIAPVASTCSYDTKVDVGLTWAENEPATAGVWGSRTQEPADEAHPALRGVAL